MRYKVGDRVKVKSLQWFKENSDDRYNVVLAGGWYFSKPMSILCGKELIIEKICHVANPPYYTMRGNTFIWTDDMIEGLVEEENVLNKWTGLKVELELSKSVIGVSNVESLSGERFMSGFVKAIIPPDGYQFVDENGNVINATKIVLEKKNVYPKTYEECCKVMDCAVHPYITADEPGITSYYEDDLNRKVLSLRKLIICRDAYWKIAGEEMGLGKPWEPPYGCEPIDIFCLEVYQNRITKVTVSSANHCIFTFPTPEMRDVFKENFDPDIESCKELL